MVIANESSLYNGTHNLNIHNSGKRSPFNTNSWKNQNFLTPYVPYARRVARSFLGMSKLMFNGGGGGLSPVTLCDK